MTSPGPSPPRSKKESSDADDDPDAPLAVRDRRAARRDRAAAKAAARAAKADHIVEAPRGPGRSDQQRRLIRVVAGAIGAIGLICSLLLAFSALLVALDVDKGGVYDHVSAISDRLIGPLRDAFSFSGGDAATKESLVAWGGGAIIYLLISLVAQSLQRSAADE